LQTKSTAANKNTKAKTTTKAVATRANGGGITGTELLKTILSIVADENTKSLRKIYKRFINALVIPEENPTSALFESKTASRTTLAIQEVKRSSDISNDTTTELQLATVETTKYIALTSLATLPRKPVVKFQSLLQQ
jgi:hypothetical protein